MKTLLAFVAAAVVGLVLTVGAATTQAPKAASSVSYVGSSKSTIYHLPSCSSAKKITPSNLVTFASKDDAAKKGYRACKVCKP